MFWHENDNEDDDGRLDSNFGELFPFLRRRRRDSATRCAPTYDSSSLPGRLERKRALSRNENKLKSRTRLAAAFVRSQR